MLLLALLDGLQSGACSGSSARSHRRTTSRFLGLSFPGLNAILPHGKWSVNTVQLVVQSAGIAHGFAIVVAPPKCGGPSAAVGAAQAHPPGGSLRWGKRRLALKSSEDERGLLTALTRRLLGLISGRFIPFILWYSPQALHR